MVGQLILICCAAALLAIGFGLLVRKERGWVFSWPKHPTALFELIAPHQVVVSSAVPGMVYLINREVLEKPLEHVDVAYTEDYLRRFYKDDGTVEWLMKYSLTFKKPSANMIVGIRNLTDVGE